MKTTLRIPPPIESLKGILDYNQETGDFRWLVTVNARAKAGSIAGCCSTGFPYRTIRFKGQLFLAHRLAWWMVYGENPPALDHINGVKTDNRIANLRVATPTQNVQNRKGRKNRKHNLPRGVAPTTGKPTFRAYITVNRKYIHLGAFDTPEEASACYEAARKERFGAFAPT